MKIERKAHKILVLCLGVSVIALSGCSRDLYEEGTIAERQMQLEETKFVEQIPAAEFDAGYARALSDHYTRSGDGAVELSVLYDPQSRTNTAMNASQEVSRISRLMRDSGVDHVSSNILPVKGAGDAADVLVTFVSYALSAPKDCGAMPGFKDKNVGKDEDYELGCTLEATVARQISRPNDLKGRELAGNPDGRRAANVTDAYRAGIQNKPLGGESASDN